MLSEIESPLSGLAKREITATNQLNIRARSKYTKADYSLFNCIQAKAIANAAYALVGGTPACKRPSAVARAPVAGISVPAFPNPKCGMLT